MLTVLVEAERCAVRGFGSPATAWTFTGSAPGAGQTPCRGEAFHDQDFAVAIGT
jgi:hypothetical protein